MAECFEVFEQLLGISVFASYRMKGADGIPGLSSSNRPTSGALYKRLMKHKHQKIIRPVSYICSLNLVKNANAVLADSSARVPPVSTRDVSTVILPS